MTTFNDPRLGASLDNPSLEDRVINLSRELAVANGALEQANDKIGLLTLAKNDLSRELSETATCLVSANDKIALLTLAKNDMDQALERAATWNKMHKRLALQIDNVETIIKDAIIADSVDEDTLKEIADELCIALTREVRIKMKITANGTATVPIGFKHDDIYNEISVEFSNAYGADVEFDIEVDDMDLDCEDI